MEKKEKTIKENMDIITGEFYKALYIPQICDWLLKQLNKLRVG